LFPLEFFWGAVIVAGLYGAFQIRRRLKSMIAQDPSLEPGARVLVRTIVFLVTVIPLINAVLGYLGGFSRNPAWWASSDLSNPYVLAHFVSLVVFVGVALWWAWLANGPARLLKYREVFSGAGMSPFDLGPVGLKWFITVVCVVFMTVRIGLLFVDIRR